MKNLLLLVGLSCFVFGISSAAKVDTVRIYSASMRKSIKTVVIAPFTQNKQKRFPVIYLLHGYGDNYANWIQEVPRLVNFSDSLGIIFVCPDGGTSSWYWDSPVDSSYLYETFVAHEVVHWIDSAYKTINNRNGRAISGLSMGGHGGLFLGIRHQDNFGACGSMSGGVDIRPFPDNWEMEKRIGLLSKNPKLWDSLTVMGQLHLLRPNSISMIIDCGTEDFFYNVNQKLHEELLFRNIPHDFISRPGNHEWPYWHNAIIYQVIFFVEYFRNSGR